MKYMISTALIALFWTSVAHAAGETKSLKLAVDETKLLGYNATQPSGWARFVRYGAATPSSVATQSIYAVSAHTGTGIATVPPSFASLTLISLANVVLSKEYLPSAVQISQAECTGWNSLTNKYELCPQFGVNVSTVKSLPGRLILDISKTFFAPQPTTKTWIYIFDPNGAVGSADRWLLAEILTQSGRGYTPGLGPVLSYQPADTNFYEYKRASPTSMQVYSIVPK